MAQHFMIYNFSFAFVPSFFEIEAYSDATVFLV
jgi:hypothetical protein